MMNKRITNKPSETNWARVDALADEEIDTSDIPPLTAAQLAHSTLRASGHPTALTVHVDPDVLAWFKAQGAHYEQRINAALRLYAEIHQAVVDSTPDR